MARQAPAKRIACKRLTVTLIKPSKYDDEGYVIRHFRDVLRYGNAVQIEGGHPMIHGLFRI